MKDTVMRFFALDLSLLNLRDTVFRFGVTQNHKENIVILVENIFWHLHHFCIVCFKGNFSPAIKDTVMRFFAFYLSLLNLRDTVFRFGPTQTTKKISLLKLKIYFGTSTIFTMHVITNFWTDLGDRVMRFFALDLSLLSL
jgi:hypothetical protein